MFVKLTAGVLAILIANPFCCCLATGEMEPVEAEQGTHACCQMAVNVPTPAEVPDEDAPCECDGESVRDLMVEKSTQSLSDTEWTLLASVERVLSAREVMPVESERAWAGMEPPAPPGKRLSQVYCVYRL
jgi:hypothetical protein